MNQWKSKAEDYARDCLDGKITPSTYKLIEVLEKQLSFKENVLIDKNEEIKKLNNRIDKLLDNFVQDLPTPDAKVALDAFILGDFIQSEETLLKNLAKVNQVEIENKKRKEKILYDLAELNAIQGNLNIALKYYQNLYELDPKNIDYLLHYTGALYDFGDFNKIYKLLIEVDLEDNISKNLNLLIDLTAICNELNLYNEALKYSKICIENANDDVSILFKVYLNQSLIYSSLCKYDNALKSAKIAEVIFYTKLDRNAISEIKLLQRIGTIYHEMGNYTLAEKYYLFAIKIAGDTHPYTAQLLSNIGIIKSLTGNENKAIELYKEAYKINSQYFTDDDYAMTSIYVNLGVAYYNIEDFDRSIQYYKKALDISKNTLGKINIETANIYSNLANSELDANFNTEAYEHMQKALEIKLQLVGETHESTAKTYNNIGRYWFEKNNFNKAIYYFSKAYTVNKIVLGEFYDETKKTKYNLDIVKNKV